MATGMVARIVGAGARESEYNLNHLVREVQEEVSPDSWELSTDLHELGMAESLVMFILVCRSGFWF